MPHVSWGPSCWFEERRLLALERGGDVDAGGEARGREAGQRGREERDRERRDDQCDRRVEVDRPAETLFIDDVDEDPRERVAHHEAGGGRGEAEEGGLEYDHRAQLARGEAAGAQQRELARALEDQRGERVHDAEDGDEDGDAE